MGNFKIFVVEDDIIFAKRLKYLMEMDKENEVEVFYDGQSFLKELSKKPDLITLDYHLPDISGDKILKRILQMGGHIPVVVISGQQDVYTAIEMLKNGAYDYMVKSDNIINRLHVVLQNVKEKKRLEYQLQRLEEELKHKYTFSKLIIGKSASIKHVFSLMQKTLDNKISVSIKGETGTGKELIAKAIHYNSVRKKEPFVAVNVSAIPSELIESEMFGFEKGAFTGAINQRKGKFEEAQGGTLFLDEIGDMELTMQAKLLRVLQEEEVYRIGSNKSIKTDCRIIVASHKNISEEVKKGRFREDLYYRLLGFLIELPPLRQREQDVLLLSDFFIKSYCEENHLDYKKLTPGAITKLKSYKFPGNVRELKAIIELALVMTNTSEIQAQDLSFDYSQQFDRDFHEEMSLKEYNKKIVHYYLKKHHNNIKTVADILDIGQSTIYKMIKE
ncbi:MAG: regulator [Bacteroidetes bacterium 4572_77]|nr:MAG: regulator [Bacteroidetes bacterium 4572_77]